VTIVTVCL